MDEWTRIVLEAEEMWANSAAARSLSARELDPHDYNRMRDQYKAHRIYTLYGYVRFCQFVERCPHIINDFDDLVPCKRDNQCDMFCHKYNFEKGCTLNATE